MSEREPNIEDQVIESIKEAWEKYPDMRLAQLLVNAIAPDNPCIEIYNTEDSDLISLLNRFKNQ